MNRTGRETLPCSTFLSVTVASLLLATCNGLPLPAACDRGNVDSAESDATPRLTTISAGATHTCAVMSDGQVSCWGGNITATLGDGTTRSRSVPIQAQDLSGVVSVGAGDQSTCVVVDNGDVQCWGLPLTSPPASFVETPTQLERISGAVSVSLGTTHGCALLRTGRVTCFGDNGESQLGSGGATDRGPVEVHNIEDAVAVSVGGRTTCVVGRDGAVRCWGNNDFSQLGDGSTQRRREPEPVQGIGSAVDVSVSQDHACALQRDGTLWCWGRNHQGQLGAPAEASVGWPRQVEGFTDVTSVEAGGGFTCATKRDGTVWCFGADTGSHPGGGDESITLEARHRPTQVQGVEGAAAVTSGATHACALLRDGSVRCWGNNIAGQLGDGTPLERTTAISAKGISTAWALSANRDHTCVASKSGEVSCWGRLWPSGFHSEPTPIKGVSDATQVAVGSFHGCALTSQGEVVCWGGNDHGQLGDGTHERRPTAVPVPELSKVAGLAAGERHSCAVTESGQARCWGSNADGQLGDGTSTLQASPRPLLVTPEVASVAAASSWMSGRGRGRTCVISRGGGKLLCLGAGYETWENVPDRFAKLLVDDDPGDAGPAIEHDGGRDGGFGPSLEAPPPIRSSEPYEHPEPVRSVALSSCKTCAVERDGAVYCWETIEQSKARVAVPGIAKASDVAVSGNTCVDGLGPNASGHACSLLDDGRVMCWGKNGLGQLGDGTTEDRAAPVLVQGVADAVALSAGLFHSCAMVQSGAVLCWGNDSWGQLGSGRLLNSSTPLGVCASGTWDGQGCAGGELFQTVRVAP